MVLVEYHNNIQTLKNLVFKIHAIGKQKYHMHR